MLNNDFQIDNGMCEFNEDLRRWGVSLNYFNKNINDSYSVGYKGGNIYYDGSLMDVYDLDDINDTWDDFKASKEYYVHFNYNQALGVCDRLLNDCGIDNDNVHELGKIVEKNKGATFLFHQYGANPNLQNYREIKKVINLHQDLDVDVEYHYKYSDLLGYRNDIYD